MKNKDQKSEEKEVICIYCHTPIHIDEFGGIQKEGSFHKECFAIGYPPKPEKEDWESEYDLLMNGCEVVHIYETEQFKKIKDFIKENFVLKKEQCRCLFDDKGKMVGVCYLHAKAIIKERQEAVKGKKEEIIKKLEEYKFEIDNGDMAVTLNDSIEAIKQI